MEAGRRASTGFPGTCPDSATDAELRSWEAYDQLRRFVRIATGKESDDG